jgi:hypothetical protein
VLIFCGTKACCRETAALIAQCINIPERATPTGAAAAAAAATAAVHDEDSATAEVRPHSQQADSGPAAAAAAAGGGKTARQRLAEKLASPVYRSVNAKLRKLLVQGIAWHNADLSHEERLLVEEAYSTGELEWHAACKSRGMHAYLDLQLHSALHLCSRQSWSKSATCVYVLTLLLQVPRLYCVRHQRWLRASICLQGVSSSVRCDWAGRSRCTLPQSTTRWLGEQAAQVRFYLQAEG